MLIIYVRIYVNHSVFVVKTSLKRPMSCRAER